MKGFDQSDHVTPYFGRESGGPTTRLVCSQQVRALVLIPHIIPLLQTTDRKPEIPDHRSPATHSYCLQPGCRESRPHGTFQRVKGPSTSSSRLTACRHADMQTQLHCPQSTIRIPHSAFRIPHPAEQLQRLAGTRDDYNIFTISLLASEMRGFQSIHSYR